MKKILFRMMLLGSMGAIPTMGFANQDCKDDSRYPNIQKSELKKLIDKQEVFVIDVNSKDSFKKARVPGAIHFETTRKELAKKLPEKKDALIVAYCGGPQCTAWRKAATEACKLGYTNVRHFKEGIKGWTSGS